MSSDVYSTYQAKAHLSEILRKVRRGKTVIVTHHGKPVAEIRPIASREGLEGRLQSLAERGILKRSAAAPRILQPVVKRAGALDRFLEERD